MEKETEKEAKGLMKVVKVILIIWGSCAGIALIIGGLFFLVSLATCGAVISQMPPLQ